MLPRRRLRDVVPATRRAAAMTARTWSGVTTPAFVVFARRCASAASALIALGTPRVMAWISRAALRENAFDSSLPPVAPTRWFRYWRVSACSIGSSRQLTARRWVMMSSSSRSSRSVSRGSPTSSSFSVWSAAIAALSMRPTSASISIAYW